MTVRATRTASAALPPVIAAARRPARAARRTAGLARRRVLAGLARAHHTVRPGCVALTFDDGPHPVFTPMVLDLLDETGAKATFFVIGERAEAHPAIVERMVADGHAVGSHTMHHADLRAIARGEARREIDQGRAAVEQVLGLSVPLFRPPHGHLTLRSALLLRSPRWRTALWTTDAYDWKSSSDSHDIAHRALQVGDGGVVVLHDTSQRSLDAVRTLIPRLRERDLQLVAL